MKPRTYIVCFASAFAFAFAHAASQSNPSGRTRSTAEEAALAGVKKGHEAYLAAMRANDADAFARVVAPDVVFSPPNTMPVAGREAIRAWFQSGAEQMRTVAITVEDRNVIVAGDLAIEEGTFVWTVVPAGGGAPIVDRGRFNATWKRQSAGEWHVLRNIWNSSLPAPAAADTRAAGAEVQSSDADAIKSSILAVLNRMLDAAEKRDAQCFAHISTRAEVRLGSEGTTPSVAEFRVEWDDAMKQLARQHFADRHSTVQVLAPDIAVSTTRAKYWVVDANGGASRAVPFAYTAVWQREGGEWQIVNAHQSVKGNWPRSPGEFASVDTATMKWEEVNLRPPLRWYAKGLVEDPDTGMGVAVIRYPAGVTNPRHTHPNGHGMYVLEGQLVTSRGTFGPGTFAWFPEGEVMEHGATAERDVVLLFITNKTFGIDYLDTPSVGRQTLQ